MSGDKLNVDVLGYLDTLGIPPPPPITPDTPPAVASWIEAATAALVAAANLGDPQDIADAEKGHAERQALASDAASKFPANEDQQAASMNQTAQMAQQLPQMASSMAGAIAGALGGALQPLTQIPQQFAQAGQQLLQTGMGALQHSGADESSPDDWQPGDVGDGLDSAGGDGDIGDSGAGGGGGVGDEGATTPTAMLGPPATPSPTTAPTAGRAIAPIVPATTAPPPTPSGGMGGMPMMPHGGMGATEAKENKAATKRISVPTVKNGAPIQGRITTPPAVPVVTKSADTKPNATRRRVVIPTDKSSGNESAGDRMD